MEESPDAWEDPRTSAGPTSDALRPLQAVGAQFFTGYDAAEPTLGITSDGTLFMNAWTRGGPVPLVLRSADQGRTWQDVTPEGPFLGRQHPETWDPYLFVDPASDRVFWNDNMAAACTFLSWSDDRGETWTLNPAACGTPGVNDHQTLGAAKPRILPTVGYPSVVYFCSSQVAASTCATSLDGGTTFGPSVVVNHPVDAETRFCAGLTGHLAADAEGRVFLPRGCSTAQVAVSENDGLAWRTHVIDSEHRPATYEHDVGVGVDEAGTVYAAWQAEDGFLWLSWSRDHGAIWSPAQNVTPPGVTAVHFSAVAGGGPGRAAIAYIGTTAPGGYAGYWDDDSCSVFCEPRFPNATWNAYFTLILGADTDDPQFLSVIANDPGDPVARDACGRTRCYGMYDFNDVEIDADGRPWASFVDVCNYDCSTDANATSQEPVAFVATLLEGPALRGPPGKALDPLPPPPPRPGA